MEQIRMVDCGPCDYNYGDCDRGLAPTAINTAPLRGAGAVWDVGLSPEGLKRRVARVGMYRSWLPPSCALLAGGYPCSTPSGVPRRATIMRIVECLMPEDLQRG
jgi:hypothetical protein